MFGLNPWVLLGLVAAFIANGFYWDHKGHSRGVEQTTLDYETKLQDQRDEAAAMLAASKDAVIAWERKFYAFTMEVGKKHAEDQKRIDGLRIANGRLVDAAGGLFDRNGRPSREGGSSGVPGDSTAASTAEQSSPGCRLSEAVANDLLDLARDADAAANYAAAGHRYAVGMPRQ